MAILGIGGNEILRQLSGNVIHFIKKKQAPCTATCDGFILKMHYQWSFWIFLTGFCVVWYSWYTRDTMICVSHFNSETQVRLDYINICLSYPYTEEENGQERRYLLFYRWIHFSFLAMAVVYYIPRKFSKIFENPRIKKLVEDLATHTYSMEQHVETELVKRASRYMTYNWRTHDGIYYKFLICNCVAVVIDFSAFSFLDFLFQGRFWHYGWMAYPFTRDPENFSDYMSRMFPPFAKCEIGPNNQLVAKRTEIFGCHLAVMELYEKIFLIVWVWLIILTTVTFCYIIFLLFLRCKYIQFLVLRIAKPVDVKSELKEKVTKDVIESCKIGDIYILYRIKQHLCHRLFFELMSSLTSEEISKTISDGNTNRTVQAKNQENIRSRKPDMNIIGSRKFFSDGHTNRSILVE